VVVALHQPTSHQRHTLAFTIEQRAGEINSQRRTAVDPARVSKELIDESRDFVVQLTSFARTRQPPRLPERDVVNCGSEQVKLEGAHG